jgi:uncharacterized coiled-coil DUF342 family protein
MLEDPVEDYLKKLEEIKIDIEGLSEEVVPISGARKIIEELLIGQVQNLIQELNKAMDEYNEEVKKLHNIANENLD